MIPSTTIYAKKYQKIISYLQFLNCYHLLLFTSLLPPQNYVMFTINILSFHIILFTIMTSQEAENSKLYRLVCKLGTINERPDKMNKTQSTWADTGDR